MNIYWYSVPNGCPISSKNTLLELLPKTSRSWTQRYSVVSSVESASIAFFGQSPFGPSLLQQYPLSHCKHDPPLQVSKQSAVHGISLHTK